MAVSDSSKVDLLYKKLFGVTKTDTPTNKGAGNESIASPALIRGDKVWTESASIPGTAAAVTDVVQSYLTTSRIECTADTTSTPISSVYPTWKTNLTNWIPPEFGSTYFVKVYAETAGNANPTNGTSLSDSGAGNAGEWYFDYQSGVLNFIGGTIPAALTAAKVIYITGYRYIGAVGITSQTTANVANTVLSISNFTTANLAEGTNLYYTNSRVLSIVTPVLTTSNVAEGSNLYYTNARVLANVSQMSINVFADVDITGITNNGTLIWNGSSFVAGTASASDFASSANVANTVLSISNFTTANLAEGINLYYTNARVVSAVTPYLTTSNVSEGSNLYYTNARVNSNVIAFLPSLAGAGIQIQANGQINATAQALSLDTLGPFLTTSNVAEGSNLYYTNARVISAITPYLTTSNVAEGSNLYYTNARVLANVSQMSINVFADVDMTGLQTSGILIWNGSVFVAGTVNAATTSNTALFSNLADRANTAELANVANSVLSISNFTTSNLIEGSNLYFTNTRAAIGLTGQDISVKDLYAAGNLTVQGDFITLNVATLDIEDKNITLGKGLTTSAQADTAGISIDGAQANITYFVTGDKFEINKNVRILGDIQSNTWTGLYSGNVLESTNQFFTNARAVLAITPYLTTANVLESASNLYYTNARVFANVSEMSVNVFTDVDISGINNDELLLWNAVDRVFRPSQFSNKLTTANVIELTNLYFTNARVITALSSGTANLSLYNLSTTGVLTLSSGTNDESVAGLEFSNNPAGGAGDTAKIKYFAANIGVNDDTILEISVANNPGDSINFKTMGGGVGVNVARPIAEFDVAGNINARNSLLFSTLVTGPTALFNTVTANTWNNLYTSNVIEGNNLYYTNARVLSIVTPLLTTSNVAEGSNLYYTDARVYSAIQGNLAIKANVTDLTTSNVVEGTNQYFTNARVFANVAQMSVNVFADVDITGVSTGYALVWDGSKFITSAPSSVVSTANTAAFAFIANVANSVVSISNFTTDNLAEGSNLYFTNARVISGLVGQDVNLNNLTVAGDLVVQGNTVTLNTATLIVEDKNILLANGAINAAAADGAGFNIAGAQANLTYRSTGDKFELNKPLDVLGNVKVSTAINYANTTNVTKVYQYYNESTQSLDTIFL